MTIKQEAKEMIAQRIKQARDEQRMSQAQLAEESGFSPSAILRWEKKTNLIPLDRLIQIADVLEKNLSYFLQDLGENQATVESFDGKWLQSEETDPSEVKVRLRDLVEVADDVDIYVRVSPSVSEN